MRDHSQLRVKLTNSLGLHLRPASRLVQLTRQFQSEVRVFCDGRAVDGKSILDLITLGAGCGAHLEIEVIGPDAEEATAGLYALIDEGFHVVDGGLDRNERPRP